MHSNLPIHPSLLHPLTGAPLRAIWVAPDGSVKWPIMGGDDTVPPPDPTPPAPTPPAPTPPAPSPPAPKPDDELGFPKDTPVSQMTEAQKIAYNDHMRERNKETARAFKAVTGDRTPEQLKADLDELDRLKRDRLSDQEKAVEDAKASARAEVVGEYGPKAVRTALKLLLGDMPEAEQEAEIELLDLRKFITDSGDVDTDKVRRAAAKIAPDGKDEAPRKRDFGAGDRKSGDTTGVAAGRSLFQERRGKKTTESNTSS